MKKLLILTKYSRMGASSRLRSLQYLPWLQEAGFETDVRPLFDDRYLEGLYTGKSEGKAALAKRLLTRMGDLRAGRQATAIWIEKEALPWLPWLIEGGLWPRGVPVISDYDDAIFHNYDLHRRGAVRFALGRKIDRVMARSALVLAGNDYLAARARAAGAPRVEIVPTVVDSEAHPPAFGGGTTPRIGWIGTPVTWARYGQPMMPLLQEVAATNGAVLRAVGAGKVADAPRNFEFPAWSEDSEIGLIQGMDLGIMPLDDDPFSRGKCGYKLIQYMACGLPVVASPVGVNREIVRHGENGFLAETPEDWRRALETLLGDRALRQRMGAVGRARVGRDFSIHATGPRVVRLVNSLL